MSELQRTIRELSVPVPSDFPIYPRVETLESFEQRLNHEQETKTEFRKPQ